MNQFSPPKRPAPWLDLDLADRPGEEWRDVAGYDGYYQVSSHGRVQSLPRLDRQGHRVHARIKKQKVLMGKAMGVGLCVDGVQHSAQVLRLVGGAFFPRLGPGQVWYHRNKRGTLDNSVANIVIGNQSESHLLNARFGLLAYTAENGKWRRAEKQAYDAQFGVFVDGVLVSKQCASCLEQQPIARFGYGGRVNTKRDCHDCSDRKNGVQQVGKAKRATELAHLGLRSCTYCKVVKALDAFANNRNNYLGKSNGCKPCSYARSTARARAKRAAKKEAE